MAAAAKTWGGVTLAPPFAASMTRIPTVASPVTEPWKRGCAETDRPATHPLTSTPTTRPATAPPPLLSELPKPGMISHPSAPSHHSIKVTKATAKRPTAVPAIKALKRSRGIFTSVAFPLNDDPHPVSGEG
jgi:hypothetical protein